MKRPIVIEFSGLPNSGKTTLLHNLDKLCKSNGINAIIIQEPAELLPKLIPKGSIEQNLWITLETLQKNLEISFQTKYLTLLLIYNSKPPKVFFFRWLCYTSARIVK